LIQGGGDGLALREVLRDPRVEEVMLVDIDGVVVEACREHLADLHQGSFDDPRAKIQIGDILTYLSESPGVFDVVLADLLDVYGPGSLELYRRVLPLTRRALAPDGIVVLFGELVRPTYRVATLYRELARSFKHVEMYRACIDSFACEYGFVLASDVIEFRKVPTETLRHRADGLAGDLKALVPEHFPAAFLLPRHIEEHLRRVLKDDFHEPVSPEETMSWIYPENQS
jgi:spermidine synthase